MYVLAFKLETFSQPLAPNEHLMSKSVFETEVERLTTTGAGTATKATRASRVPPHPQPRVVNISGAKIGKMHAMTDRS